MRIPRYLTRIGLGAFLLVAIAAAWQGVQPPRPLPLDAPPTAFSGDRAIALSHLFANEPRPRGGEAAARGRDFIARTLKEYGVEVEIQRDPVNHGMSISFVENVLGRIKGTDSTQTFGMTAHYDSVAWGPGAADDGAGVVVMLEAARALKCGPPLRHDVVFVFTGDEEGGGNGSVKSLSPPWLKDLNVMLGLEGRGGWGSAFMFETSEGNLPLMYEIQKSGAPSVSNAIMYQVHRLTPNTTDFTHMAKNGALGYNVAFVGGLGYYHTANDTTEHLSPRTIQHQGDYALALVRHYDNGGPKIAKGEEAVFFNTLGKHLVVYPASWSRPLAIAAGVLALLALGIGFYTRKLRPLALLGSVALLVAAIAITAAVGWGLTVASYKIFYVYIMYNAAYYHIACMLLGAGVLSLLLYWTRRRLSPESLQGATLLLLIAGVVVMEMKVPIASYALTWPLMFGAVGLALACVLRRAGMPPGAGVLVQTLSALPVIFFLVPGMDAFYDMGGAISPAGNAALLLALGAAVSPALWLILGDGGKRVAQVSLVLGLAVFLAGWAMQRYTAETPKMNSLSYAVNLDTNEARWITTDAEPDDWVRQFIPADQAVVGEYNDVLPGKFERYAHAPAPLVPLPATHFTALEDTTAEGRRTLVLQYDCMPDAGEIDFVLESPHVVLAASVDGMGDVMADMSGWHLRVGYPPHDKRMVLRLTIDAANTEPVRIRVMEDIFTLPELTTLGYRPRPEWMIPKPNTLDWWEENRQESHHTYVTKTYTF